MHHLITQISHGTATAAPFLFQKFVSIRSQGLGPIKRPLTASFYSNIRKTLKIGVKLKCGETPTSRSLRKLPKSGTHAKLSLRRAAFLFVPKVADGWIACIFRENFSLSLKSSQNAAHCDKNICISRFGLFFNWRRKHYTLFCHLVT